MMQEEEFKIEINTDLPPRLQEIQQKIQDPSYVNFAIDRIAVVLSKRIVDMHTYASRTSVFDDSN